MSPLQEILLELRDKELIVGEIKRVPTGLVTLSDAEELLEKLEIKMLNNGDLFETRRKDKQVSGYKEVFSGVVSKENTESSGRTNDRCEGGSGVTTC